MDIRLFLIGFAAVVTAGCSSLNHASLASSLPPVPNALKSGTDQQTAQAAILNQQDMGPDYQATPFTPDPQATADDAAFNACLGQPATATHEIAKVYSPTFTLDFKVIIGEIVFVDTDKTAQAHISAMRDTIKTVPCLKSSLTTQLSRSGGSAQVEVRPINPPPGGTNVDVIAYRLQILATEAGQDPQPLVVDLVSARKGRAEISVHSQDMNQPVPTDIQDRIIRTMLDRLPD